MVIRAPETLTAVNRQQSKKVQTDLIDLQQIPWFTAEFAVDRRRVFQSLDTARKQVSLTPGDDTHNALGNKPLAMRSEKYLY